MEDLKKISKIIRPGLWGVKLDIKDAYHHVPLAREIWKFFRFAILIDGKVKVYYFRVLPFGLTTAPWVFSSLEANKGAKTVEYNSNSLPGHFFFILACSRQALNQNSIVIEVIQSRASNS